MAHPRVEQALVDQGEKVIIELVHSIVQRGTGVPGKMTLNAAEQLKHEGATVGCQGGIRRVKERAGEIRGEGHEGLEGLWNERGDRKKDLVTDVPTCNMFVLPAVITDAINYTYSYRLYKNVCLFFIQQPSTFQGIAVKYRR